MQNMRPIKITEHIPVYAAGFSEPETVEFRTTDELLSVEFVKCHKQHQGFYRYSIHGKIGRFRVPLLAEYSNGIKWVVIGFLDGDLSGLDLPEWKPIAAKVRALVK